MGSRCRVQTAGGIIRVGGGGVLNHSPHGSALHQSGIFPTPAEFEWQELRVRDTLTHLHGLWAHPSPQYSNYDGKLASAASCSHCFYSMSNSGTYTRV